MKKLVTRLVLLGGALPLVLAAGTGTAGADPITVTVTVTADAESDTITATVNDNTVEAPFPGCVMLMDCVKIQPAICFGGGQDVSLGVEACTAIGEH